MFVFIHGGYFKDNTEGGEHQFEGKKFGLEAHYVHGNIKYQTAEDYQKHDDGILIIAVVFNLFDVSPMICILPLTTKKVVKSTNSRPKYK